MFSRLLNCNQLFNVSFKHTYRLNGNLLQLRNNTFTGTEDRFNGMTVDLLNGKFKICDFEMNLEETLHKWLKEGRRCIWFKVNIKHSECVPILARKGFSFHHARDDFVMMYKWLPKDSAPNLPPASYTNLGVGAMVFNSRSQLLAISEKHYEYPHWKLPGGYVEKGEDIIDAAKREVQEETGIDTEFVSLVTFRHTQKMMFDNADIYVILMMKALSENIIISDREVNKCQWMDVEEYLNHPHVHSFNKLVVNRALEYRENKIKLDLKKMTVKWSTYIRDMRFLNLTKSDYDK